ncbi:hypothetical protein [Pseudomonas sp. UBA1879]|uniref:hypothetical protein n=1 Tax=Pseudomonas sp. UBA1879 TaxID=1947305 RepID=UPI0025E98E56|nr:hypothetical protein [Pseudomonas sp. UBA1879]
MGNAFGKHLWLDPKQADQRHALTTRRTQDNKHAYPAGCSGIGGWRVKHSYREFGAPMRVITAKYDYPPVAQKTTYVRLIHEAKLVVMEDSRHATRWIAWKNLTGFFWNS